MNYSYSWFIKKESNEEYDGIYNETNLSDKILKLMQKHSIQSDPFKGLFCI